MGAGPVVFATYANKLIRPWSAVSSLAGLPPPRVKAAVVAATLKDLRMRRPPTTCWMISLTNHHTLSANHLLHFNVHDHLYITHAAPLLRYDTG